MKNLLKMLVVSQITLGIDFLWILARFWLQVDVKNGAKIDIKEGWKNDEKTMIARMALRWHLGAHEGDNHLDSRAPGRRKGGGVNPSSRGVGGDGVEWMLG